MDAGAIVKLFASPLGQRMLNAEHREREFKFSLLCDAGDFFPGAAPASRCCCRAWWTASGGGGRLTVIDYKTDAVRTEDEIAARAAYYAGQLRAYAAALRRIFGKPVREGVLYFLAAGKAVSVRV